jgi:hypothetical protein
MPIPKYDGLFNRLLRGMRALEGCAFTRRIAEDAHADSEWFLGL